jgi:hypothetical protein
MKSRLISVKRIIEKEVGESISTKRRTAGLTYARAVYCKIGREMGGENLITLSEIGKLINKDHSSVFHNINVIFPFAIKESSFRELYLTLRAIFVESLEEPSKFDDMKALSEKIIDLEKENASLSHRLNLLRYESRKFEKLVEGLSKEEMDEVFDKMNIFVKAIKSRVYL